MSEPVRVAAVVEGETDFVVLRAAIGALLAPREFILKQLQPETSAAFVAPGSTTGRGWGGVYRWCRQTCGEGEGTAADSVLFRNYDVLVIHLDADVAGFRYSDGSIDDWPDPMDLPCDRPCPPPSDTTNALRGVAKNWLGLTEFPANIVFCTPSKTMETWVLRALASHKPVVARKDWECNKDPLRQNAALKPSERIKWTRKGFEARESDLRREWDSVRTLSEAERFSRDFLAAVP